jgi:hypothetical protein
VGVGKLFDVGCTQYNLGGGGHSHLYFVLCNGVFPLTEVMIMHVTRGHRIPPPVLTAFSVTGWKICHHHLLENFIVDECGHTEIHCECLLHKIRVQ